MPAEYQKDITFDEIETGDTVLVELFGEDGSYLGDRRGVAKVEYNGVWYFDGMLPVYKEALGYRLFRVTVLDGPVDPMDKLEAALRSEGDRLQAEWDWWAGAADDSFYSGKLDGLKVALKLIEQEKEKGNGKD